MFYTIIKCEHENNNIFHIEGDTLDKAIKNEYDNNDFPFGFDKEETSLKEIIKWVKEDNFEFNTILVSNCPVEEV